jgi:hypothetical protein
MTTPTVTVPKTLMRIVVRWQEGLPDDARMFADQDESKRSTVMNGRIQRFGHGFEKK